MGYAYNSTSDSTKSNTAKIQRSYADKAVNKTGLNRPEIQLCVAILGTLFVAVVLVIIKSCPGGWPLLGLNMLVGIGAGSVGAIMGFLFGIPHLNTDVTTEVQYQPSTNLEQVSDWLTKIIVGVGLVEADAIAKRLERMGMLIAGVVPGQGPVVPQVIIVVFGAQGFFSGYIWTRLNYGGMQVRADREIHQGLAPGSPAAPAVPDSVALNGQHV